MANLPARNLAEWEIVFKYEPFKEHWADARHGIACQIAAAGHGARTKAGDYHPQFTVDEEHEASVRAAKLENIRGWARALAGEVKES